jgi:hypothetical protein
MEHHMNVVIAPAPADVKSPDGTGLNPAETNGVEKTTEPLDAPSPAKTGNDIAVNAHSGEASTEPEPAPASTSDQETCEPEPEPEIETLKKELSLSSRAIHADDHISSHRAVAPALHVSTTFKYSRNPEQLEPWFNVDVSTHVPSVPYS